MTTTCFSYTAQTTRSLSSAQSSSLLEQLQNSSTSNITIPSESYVQYYKNPAIAARPTNCIYDTSVSIELELVNFAKYLIANTKSLEPQFAAVIEEDFWKILA